MRDASTYSVSFPYGATSSPYSPAHPHRGDDRPCPTGTPVVISGVTIGLTGATGNVTGAHLHIQEWHGDYATTRKPQNAFVGGTVTNIDPNGTQGDGSFGKFITIQTEDGWNDSYCHLSQINVKIGDIIGGTMQASNAPVDLYFLKLLYNLAEYRDVTDADANQSGWIGQIGSNVLIGFINAPAHKDFQFKVADYDRLNKEYQDYKKANPPGGGGDCTKEERAYLDSLYKVVKKF